MLLDHWTNVKKSSYCYIYSYRRNFILNATDCESSKKTATYCTQIATENTHHCQKFGINIFAVCTDNENKMVKMRELLEQRHEITWMFSSLQKFVGK